MNKPIKSPYGTFKQVEVEEDSLLTFGMDNAKLVGTSTATFSLPAGYTCLGACNCLAWFDRKAKKLIDGPDATLRCFAASMEAAFPSVRTSVDRNLTRLMHASTREAMAELIDLSLPSRAIKNIRIHADGDFFNEVYFLAWTDVARANPNRLFYAYTKSLPFWIKHKADIPDNLVLTASRGGKYDHLIEPNLLRCAWVVNHPEEAEAMRLEIDHDDSFAKSKDGGDFALLIHGMQPAGSDASEAIKRLKREEIDFSYGRKSSRGKKKLKAATI